MKLCRNLCADEVGGLFRRARAVLDTTLIVLYFPSPSAGVERELHAAISNLRYASRSEYLDCLLSQLCLDCPSLQRALAPRGGTAIDLCSGLRFLVLMAIFLL